MDGAEVRGQAQQEGKEGQEGTKGQQRMTVDGQQRRGARPAAPARPRSASQRQPTPAPSQHPASPASMLPLPAASPAHPRLTRIQSDIRHVIHLNMTSDPCRQAGSQPAGKSAVAARKLSARSARSRLDNNNNAPASIHVFLVPGTRDSETSTPVVFSLSSRVAMCFGSGPLLPPLRGPAT